MAAAHPYPEQQQSAWERPSTLAVGDTPAALRRCERTFEAADRSFTSILADGALERLGGLFGTVWVEMEGPFDDRLDRLLRRVDGDVAEGRYAAVVSAVPELIDPVSAAVSCPNVELVVNGSDLERTTALALASHQGSGQVRDSAGDVGGVRLRQLSDEVSRIAATLARLSTSPSAPTIPTAAIHASPSGAPAITAEIVRGVIRARRLRSSHLPADLFADPAWDMLLDLLQAEIVQHRVPVSSLCAAAAVPATTALRWIKTMTDRGIVRRRADPHDGRRVFIELDGGTSGAMRHYFAEVGALGVI